MRIRTIKPEFWTDEKTGQMSIESALVFLALLNFADDEGRLRGDLRLIRGMLFPYRESLNIQNAIDECLSLGLLLKYEVRDQSYIQIVNFRKHQRINRPTKSLLPAFQKAFSEDSVSDHGVLSEGSVNAHGVLSDDSLWERKGREGKVFTSNKGLFEDLADLTKAWNDKAAAGLARCQRLTDKRKAAIKRFLKTYTEADWERIIAGINASDFLMGRSGQAWKASFDWAINVNNAVKVLEGNYRNTQATQIVQSIPVLKRFDQPMTSKEKAALLLQTKDNHATTENR